MKKVRLNSRLELDWLSNWKIVQTSWKQLGIEKVIPVEKLIKGKFQDNFEFLQWFKKFFDANYDGHPYNPLEMRNFEELPKEGKLKANSGGTALKMPQRTAKPATGGRQLSTAAPTPRRVGSDASINSASGGSGITAASKRVPSASAYGTAARQHPQQRVPASGVGRAAAAAPAPPQHLPPKAAASHATSALPALPADAHIIEELKQKNVEMYELRNQLAESDEVISGLERERDFYFAKLRKIEVLCQDNENGGNLDVTSMLHILYETEEGFAPPADDGTNGGANGGDAEDTIDILKDD
ncbi:hypothetical protein GPALN_013100 [Globodera pallida]|nr:hypothetical protein GPALN_013100 [Globodera pallida]